jgi:UDP-3-O-[3-hydroxymyristoyl] N-acetylglucosamine deacetylase
MTAQFIGQQTTIANRIEISGIGVHSGKQVDMVLHPAVANSGVRFLRSDLKDSSPLRASWFTVKDTALCTVLGEGENRIGTVEHLMAAFYALGVDNVLVEVSAPEIPVLDGSSQLFIEAIENVGIRALPRARKAIRITKPVHVSHGDATASFLPHPCFAVDVTISFDTPVIGEQRYQGEVTAESFKRDLAFARTFGFKHQVEYLNARGLALGSSLENSVGIDENGIMNEEGLRHPEEFVRHKTLDAVGDLAMAGLPLIGLYRSFKGGHKLNFEMVKAVLESPESWMLVEEAVDQGASFGKTGKLA